jgi:hypothetical protein
MVLIICRENMLDARMYFIRCLCADLYDARSYYMEEVAYELGTKHAMNVAKSFQRGEPEGWREWGMYVWDYVLPLHTKRGIQTEQWFCQDFSNNHDNTFARHVARIRSWPLKRWVAHTGVALMPLVSSGHLCTYEVLWVLQWCAPRIIKTMNEAKLVNWLQRIATARRAKIYGVAVATP